MKESKLEREREKDKRNEEKWKINSNIKKTKEAIE